MKSKRMVWMALFVLACASFSFARPALASEKDEAAVKQAVTQFYAALNSMFTGNVAPMEAVWSHAKDATYMGPTGGFYVGWKQVLPAWQAQAAMKLGGKVTPADMHIAVGRNLAIAENYERGENTNAAGKTQKVSIRATNVFREEGGQWKMIGHHTDLLSYLQK